MIRAGAVFGLLAVIAGAFGGHALREELPPERLAVYETGVRYQMYHALALVLTGLLCRGQASRWLSAAGVCFLVGILLFSFSLQFLAVSGVRAAGMITPFGGGLLIAGWALLAIGAAPRCNRAGG